MNRKKLSFKRILACLMVVVMTLSAVPMSGFVGLELPKWSEMFATKASAATSGYYTYTVSDGEATITDYSTSGRGSITIPSSLGGYPVTSIGERAFFSCTNLTSVTIPDSVTSIGNNAFESCSSLTSVTIPNSVIYIGRNAFVLCKSLKKIDVSVENTSFSAEDGILFNKDKTELIVYPCCKEDTEYTVPNSVTSIADSAFRNCTSLITITIPNSVTNIDVAAFEDCSNLISITIPDSVTSIGAWAFSFCTNLTSVKIGNSVTSLDLFAFQSCNSLNEINVSEENTSFTSEDGILFNKDKTELIVYPCCKEDTEYTIPNSVTSIDCYAFADCTRLTSVTIPYGVTSIDRNTFDGCTSLITVSIPDSITSIGYRAFYHCSGLNDVYYTSSKNQWQFISIDGYNSDLTNATIHFNHTHSYVSVIIEDATCIEHGIMIYTCSCNGRYTELIPALGHSFTHYVSNGDATCTADGTKTAKCDRCDVTDTIDDVGSAKGHTEEIIPAIPATCTETGLTEGKKCSVCGKIIVVQTETDALDHSFTNYVSNGDATCTADGTKTAKCDRCDVTDTVTDEGSAKGHTIVIDKAVAPTCTETGLTEGQHCSVCGEVLVAQTETDALGHSFTNYVSNGNATCTADGTKTAKCDRCDVTNTVTDENTKLGHSFTNYVSNGDATCTADGTKTAKCDRCDVTDTVPEKNTKLGHSFTHYVSNGNATCTADGTKTAKCDRCDVTDTVTDEGSAKGHTIVIDKAAAPTCTKTGLTEGKHCSVCNTVLVKQEVIPATGHNDNNSDELCDSCGEDLGTHTPSENCTCICHKGGFMGFIYKIIRIFWKLFRINKDCTCGQAHY